MATLSHPIGTAPAWTDSGAKPHRHYSRRKIGSVMLALGALLILACGVTYLWAESQQGIPVRPAETLPAMATHGIPAAATEAGPVRVQPLHEPAFPARQWAFGGMIAGILLVSAGVTLALAGGGNATPPGARNPEVGSAGA